MIDKNVKCDPEDQMLDFSEDLYEYTFKRIESLLDKVELLLSEAKMYIKDLEEDYEDAQKEL